MIRGVEGADIREMTTGEVRELVRGETGTFVVLNILRDGKTMDISVERRQIETQVAAAQLL